MSGQNIKTVLAKKRMQPLISVIVPVYQAESYIQRCVESIMNQTYSDIEIMLIDDGSKDNGGMQCDMFAQSDKRVHVIHKKNNGLMSAWMTGVNASKGQYLCFVDSDDWIEPDMIHSLAEKLTWSPETSKSRNEIICSNFLIDRANGETPQEKKHEILPGEYEGAELIRNVFENILGNENRTVTLSRCMKLFSRNLIEENMHYCDTNVRMGEDVNIVLPAILDCRRLVLLDGHYDYHYFYNPTSMVHHYDAGLHENIKRLYLIINQILKEKYEKMGIKNVDPCKMADREYCYLFCLVLKNELRSGRKGLTRRMVDYCRQSHMKDLVRETDPQPEDRLNRILFLFMKYPSRCVAFCMYVGLLLADLMR